MARWLRSPITMSISKRFLRAASPMQASLDMVISLGPELDHSRSYAQYLPCRTRAEGTQFRASY